VHWTNRLADIDALPSTGSVGDSYDNALAESVNGAYKAELIHHPEQGSWAGLGQVELATGDWVNWYNTDRPHSYCADLPPIDCETEYRQRHPHPPVRNKGLTQQ
jgi:putative transposase